MCSFLMSSSKLTVPGRAAVTRSYWVESSSQLRGPRFGEMVMAGHTLSSSLAWVSMAQCISVGSRAFTEARGRSWLERTPRPIHSQHGTGKQLLINSPTDLTNFKADIFAPKCVVVLSALDHGLEVRSDFESPVTVT